MIHDPQAAVQFGWVGGQKLRPEALADNAMYYHALWAVLCALVASIPWICAVGFAGVRRVTLAQIGLMVLALAIGFAAPRLGLHLHPFYTLGGMLTWSAIVAGMGVKRRDDPT